MYQDQMQSPIAPLSAGFLRVTQRTGSKIPGMKNLPLPEKPGSPPSNLL